MMKTDLLTLYNDTTELIANTDLEVRQNAKKSTIPNDLNADWVKTCRAFRRGTKYL